jgi:hypothetical protein
MASPRVRAKGIGYSSRVTKRHPALDACEGLLPSVSSNVGGQMIRPRKRLSALPTFEGLLPHVDSEVGF